MVINKKASKIQKVVWTIFVGSVFVSSIISLHEIIELSIIHTKYLLMSFLQLNAAGF